MKISIIVPVYNAEKTLETCVSSIVKQDFAKNDIEVLLVNDGSTDDSARVCQTFANQYDYIHVISKENEGVAATRNRAVGLAKGEYIVFMDNDDTLAPDYLSVMYEAVTSSDSDAVFAGFQRVDTKGDVLYQTGLSDSEWSKYVIMAPWAKIFRRDFILNNQLEFFSYPIGEDVVFTIAAIQSSSKIKTIPYKGYYWLDNETSVSNTSQRGLQEHIDLLEVCRQIVGRQTDLSDELNYFLYRYVVWYLLFSGRGSTAKLFLQEWQRYKGFLKAEVGPLKHSPFSGRFKGEKLMTRLSVAAFLTLDRLNLLSVFAKFYCRGEKIK